MTTAADPQIIPRPPVSRVNYICRFTSSAWTRCWAALVR